MLIKKSIFLIFSFLLFTTSLFAQYGNEWVEDIGYDKTFYKFKTNHNGLHRITNDALLNAGITATGNQLKVFNRGEEIPIYVTTNGVFTDNDYVEFYGETNSGYYDTQLYAEALHQPNPYFSMFESEGTYFLVQDEAADGLRFQAADNNLSAFANPNEAFNYKSELGASNTFHFGKPKQAYGSTSNFASSFGEGEGYCTSTISYLSVAGNVYNNRGIIVPTHSVDYSSTELASVTLRIIGKNESLGVYFDKNFNIIIKDSIYVHSFGSEAGTVDAEMLLHGYEVKDYTFNVPLSALSDTTDVWVEVFDGQGIPNFPLETEISIGSVIIEYPRVYDFGDINNLKFNVTAEQTEYFQINNFNGGNAPVIYDLTSHERIIPNSNNGNYRFKLNPNTNPERTLYISSTEFENTVHLVEDLTARNYNNFNASEGDYILIYNKLLSNTDCGDDQIQRYINYRNSDAGGSYNVAAIEIEDLYDLFAHGIDKHPLSIKHFINFAIDIWNVKPDMVNLIGKGVQYNLSRFFIPGRAACLVPSYGHKASDIMFSSSSNNEIIPQLGVGRVPVLNCNELTAYIDKLEEYEALHNNCDEVNRQTWMNDALNIARGWGTDETSAYLDTLTQHENIMETSLLQMDVVATLTNTAGYFSSQPCGTYIDYFSTIYNDFEQVKPHLENGLNIINYIGHSIAHNWQYDIGYPEDYDSEGKYPFIISNSGHVGKINEYSTCNGELWRTQSENWVLADNSGSIAFLSATALNHPKTFSVFTKELLNNLGSTEMQGQPLGVAISESILSMKTKIEQGLYGVDLGEALEILTHEITYCGDPAVKLYTNTKPEFEVLAEDINLETNLIEANENLVIDYTLYNNGTAVLGNLNIEITVTDLSGSVVYTITETINNPVNLQNYEISIDVPNGLDGEYTVTFNVDADNNFVEYCEDNNEQSFLVYMNECPNQSAEFSVLNLNTTDEICINEPLEVEFNGQGNYLNVSFGSGSTYAQNGNSYIVNYDTPGFKNIEFSVGLGDCMITETKIIKVREEYITDNLLSCGGVTPTSLTLHLLTTYGVDSYAVYLNGEFIDNLNSLSYTFLNLEFETDYTIEVLINGDSPCEEGLISPITCSTVACNLPVISNFNPIILCEGEGEQLNAQPAGGIYTIIETNEQLLGGEISSLEVGAYNIEYYYEQNGCSITDTIFVAVRSLPIFEISESIAICEGDTTLISVSGTDVANVVWGNGETTNEIEAMEAGLYVAQVIGNNDCSVGAGVEITYLPAQDCATSIFNNLEATSIIIFPVPSSNSITVDFGNMLNETISLSFYAIDGKVVNQTTQTVTNSTIELNIEDLPVGVYWLKVETQTGKNYTGKFIKE